jgi:hypothetical protein
MIIFSMLLVVTPQLEAKDLSYLDYHKSIYSKEVKVANLEELKSILIENELSDKKWIKYVLHMNGITEKQLNSNSSKLLTIYLPSVPVENKELDPSVQLKPFCVLLSPQKLAKMQKVGRVSYRSYHEYIYSRTLKASNGKTISAILKEDDFHYPDLSRWMKITKNMNRKNLYPRDEIFLPPCFTEPQLANKKEHIQTTRTSPIKHIQKPKIDLKRYRFSSTAALGQIHIKSDDVINSKFELTFLKIGLIAHRQMKNYGFKAGLALNSYLKVQYQSDVTSSSSSRPNYYMDVLLGITKSISSHQFTLQYDNLNYLLNQNYPDEVNLEPVRVDRLSIQDAYQINETYSLLGSLGYFPDLFSKALGFEFSFGIARRVTKYFSMSGNYSQNQLVKDNVTNKARAFVVSGNYQF